MTLKKRRRNGASRAVRVVRRVLYTVAAILLVITLALVGLALWNEYGGVRETYERYRFDTSAMAGRIQTMTEEEIQAELDRVVEEGMFNISIASSIVFEGSDQEGAARIENVESNRYHMQVELRLDKTGEVIYASDLIRPGYSIEKIRLNRRLDPGEYNATATFSAITQEEMQLYGQAAAQVRLFVPDENGRFPTPTPTASPTPQP